VDKKIKILTLSDHPLSPSGVGTQSRYMIDALLKTGKFSFISFAGAVKHNDYTPVQTDEWGEDWLIYPVDGYGNPDMIRSAIRTQKPDMLWFMTDPRFWGWLWGMENEIRPLMPMVYYHVWDNYPPPHFNKPFYDSNDLIACISKVTHDIVQKVSPDVKSVYLPHSVNTDVYKPYPKEDVENFRNEHLGPENSDKVVFVWNNRNARRKQSGSLIFWFKKFLDIVGHDKACLIMHTEPKDHNGQDLVAILDFLKLSDGQVLLSREKLPMEHLAMIYNMADCTINISDGEGFGLATFESLACGTPIMVNMTGGLQEQVTDGEKYFGIGLEPDSKAIIGSQEIPWIYEDRLSEESVVNGLLEIYNMTSEEREKLGQLGREHVMKNYNYENFCKSWEEILLKVYEEHGSWSERKNYQAWHFKEVA